ncbi:2-dehydro-3-deoxygluconokinase [Pullulanibacillus pueri]|uniref:Sugar kinase n=1 Tax=Pullulanibacillus pueri TaxID=1437324 RepID=A0A8J3ENH9_9BACL|nr:sugar kinase [Pullulanibacillus pueri]MBM7683414.1 2-dehydro-3-deoxygluconokinase [Pullulanibacillus pueri]GGH88054.1 sugar kinase [Pullulanibacillus pueri]
MDVVTLGESMVLFTPETPGYMRYASTFTSKIAGAESNVAVGLARLGHHVGWFSRLGADEFGKKIFTFLRGEGVDVSKALFDGEAPTGLYFKEMVTDEEINVYYYRGNSAASRLSPEDLDEAYIAGARYLHLTGITPALSASCRETVFKAIDIAKQKGVTVVFDPNLRRKLWSEEEARRVLLDIVSKADIVLPGISEGEFLFGKDQPEDMAKKFIECGPSSVVLKLGAEGAYYYSKHEGEGYVPGFPIKRVVDPVGAGDGFAAGFLSGLLERLPFEKAVQRGAAIGAIVTTFSGDVEGLPDRKKVETFIKGMNQEDILR